MELKKSMKEQFTFFLYLRIYQVITHLRKIPNFRISERAFRYWYSLVISHNIYGFKTQAFWDVLNNKG